MKTGPSGSRSGSWSVWPSIMTSAWITCPASATSVAAVLSIEQGAVRFRGRCILSGRSGFRKGGHDALGHLHHQGTLDPLAEELTSVFVGTVDDTSDEYILTDEELEDQFPFTQQMASTDMGILKAVTWQASPGVCVYRRSIARDVLGTDDPNAVQKELADWTKFQTTAAEMKKKEYFMVSGYYDTFAPYRFTADRHWENDGKMVIPEAMVQWRDMMDSFTKNAYHNKTQIGEKEWLADQGPAGKVFCFFRAINDIDSRMAAYSLADANMAPEEGNGIYGDYAVCCGPQSYCTGGVWILAAPSTDNLLLDREIMENLTCNSTLLYKIAQNEEIFTNTVSGMRRLAGENKTDSFLGGQNPFQVYYEAASRLNCLPAGNYDRWMGDTYRNNMIKSFTGELDRDEAMELFYTRVRDRYPELDIDD